MSDIGGALAMRLEVRSDYDTDGYLEKPVYDSALLVARVRKLMG